MKICTKCKIEKKLSEFNKNNQQTCGLSCWCKDCMRFYIHTHYIQNKVRILKRQIEYRKFNPEKVRQSQRNYYKKNKVKIIKNSIEYERIKIQTDIKLKIVKSLRSRVYQAIINKSKSTKILLGCTVKFLKKYLESQFKEGMSWNNHEIHGWHIDHIKPCASFDLSKLEEQQKCFHYTNLQPLWAKDNLKKGSKYHGRSNSS